MHRRDLPYCLQLDMLGEKIRPQLWSSPLLLKNVGSRDVPQTAGATSLRSQSQALVQEIKASQPRCNAMTLSQP